MASYVTYSWSKLWMHRQIVIFLRNPAQGNIINHLAFCRTMFTWKAAIYPTTYAIHNMSFSTYAVAYIPQQTVVGDIKGSALQAHIHGHKVLINIVNQTIEGLFITTPKDGIRAYFLSNEKLDGSINVEKPQQVSIIRPKLQIGHMDGGSKNVITFLPKHDEYIKKNELRLNEIVKQENENESSIKSIVNKNSSYFYNENGTRIDEYDEQGNAIKNVVKKIPPFKKMTQNINKKNNNEINKNEINKKQHINTKSNNINKKNMQNNQKNDANIKKNTTINLDDDEK